MSTRLFFDFLSSGAAQLLAPLGVAAGLTAALTRILRSVRERRELAWGVGFPLVAIYVLALWHEVLPSALFRVEHPEAGRIIRSGKWISYVPDRFEAARDRRLDVVRVRRELAAIRAAGFTGIVTYSMRDDLGKVAPIASSMGLSVIAGVWDPNDRNEVANAVAAEGSVVAYAVGHIGLHEGSYTFDDVVRAMQFIRFRTAHPVATTEKLERYENDPRVLSTGDWIFPDAHISGGRVEGSEGAFVFEADVDRDVAFILESARRVTQWDREDGRGREILLKTVGYPYGGVPGASPEVQARFFAVLLSQLPTRVSVAAHTAYDTDWKVGWPFYPWDVHMALFDQWRRPRPAVKVIVERL